MGDKITHIGQLKFDKRNPRKHNPRNIGVIVNSLQQVGPARSIVIDEDDSILAGNGVTEAAAIAGIEKVIEVEADGDAIIAVRRRGLTEDQKQKLKYFDNRSGELAGWDIETILADIEAGVKLDDLFNQDELAALLEEAGNELLKGAGGKDVAPQLDKAKELAELWGTEVGQVWQLGEHRLAVGDCTDRAVVEAVMRGEVIDFTFTDPPYSVSYADKNRRLNTIAPANRIQTPIENDHLSTEEAAKKIWKPAFKNMYDSAKLGCVYYLTAPQGGDQMMMMMMMLSESGWLVKHELIWKKNNHVLGRADYHYKHEPIIYGWKPGAAHYFIDDRSQTSVWEFDKPHNSDLHPTMKPIPLIEKAMSNSSKAGEVVADFFLGSGSTLIAAENLRRKGRFIELDPGYAAISIQRWVDLTSQQPTRLTG